MDSLNPGRIDASYAVNGSPTSETRSRTRRTVIFKGGVQISRWNREASFFPLRVPSSAGLSAGRLRAPAGGYAAS
jgi:hypothetical protein